MKTLEQKRDELAEASANPNKLDLQALSHSVRNRIQEARKIFCDGFTKALEAASEEVEFDEGQVLKDAALACFGREDATECVSRNFILVARKQFDRMKAQVGSAKNAAAYIGKLRLEAIAERDRLEKELAEARAEIENIQFHFEEKFPSQYRLRQELRYLREIEQKFGASVLKERE